MKKEYTLRDGNMVMVRLENTGTGLGNHWRLYSLYGTVVKQGKAEIFGEWPEDIEDEIAEKIAEYAEAAQHVPTYDAYLRFKDLPNGGRSRNYATGEYERGTSVYGLRWDVLGRGWEVVGCDNPFQLILNSMRGDVPAYIVTGERAGAGSDGEPLIVGVTIVGKAERKGDLWVLA
jgi:hypothetical protein